MTLLQIVQDTPPDKAKLIDAILIFDSEIAHHFNLGDGKWNRDGPEGWDDNKLLCLPIEKLKLLLEDLISHGCRKSSYYSDFSGEIVNNSIPKSNGASQGTPNS